MMSDEALKVYNDISEYCDTYNIPIDNLMDILEDQKVVPMIRGKATEFIGALFLKKYLNERDWSVQKLNLNAQQGRQDEDITITNRRTGKRLKAETKNAVRGKFSMGGRLVKAPHFSVKCHKSRSHLSRVTNDRYLVGDFDVLLCNVSNSIFGSTEQRGLPLIDNKKAIDWLKQHYDVNTEDEIRYAAYEDWRVCFPEDIAGSDNTIPRSPRVMLEGDPIWFGIDQLDTKLKMRLSN